MGALIAWSDWCKCDSCWLYPLVLPLRCDRESKFLILLISETSSLDGVLVSLPTLFLFLEMFAALALGLRHSM